MSDAAEQAAEEILWVPNTRSSWNHGYLSRHIPSPGMPALGGAWVGRLSSAPLRSGGGGTTAPAIGALPVALAAVG